MQILKGRYSTDYNTLFLLLIKIMYNITGLNAQFSMQKYSMPHLLS